MDDLLIVRSSERVRPRHGQRRREKPIGASFGIVLGAAFGLCGVSYFPQNPTVGLAMGIAVGLAIGGLLGPILRAKTSRIARYPRSHFGSMPADKSDDDKSKAENSDDS